jgi:hypothetical protein
MEKKENTIVRVSTYYKVVSDETYNEVNIPDDKNGKRRLKTIMKNGYFKEFMPNYQGPKERHSSGGYYLSRRVSKIYKVTQTTEQEEVVW